MRQIVSTLRAAAVLGAVDVGSAFPMAARAQAPVDTIRGLAYDRLSWQPLRGALIGQRASVWCPVCQR